MRLTAEQKAFKKAFAIKLREKVLSEGLQMPANMEHSIASLFVNALIDFKATLQSNRQALKLSGKELTWTPERNRLMLEFANRLDAIFSPIGGIKPKEFSAFWSGEGKKRAREFGVDFEKTIPGFVLNQLSASLQEIFTKKAYTEDGLLDTATNVGMWEALSHLYAQGTEENAHVFLVNGETSQHSIFWNTELQSLRERQFSGIVKDIYIHTLKPTALIRYRALLEEKSQLDSSDPKWEKINNRMDTLLKNKKNWTSSVIENSEDFKLKVSGAVVKYSTLSTVRTIFKESINKKPRVLEDPLQKKEDSDPRKPK